MQNSVILIFLLRAWQTKQFLLLQSAGENAEDLCFISKAQKKAMFIFVCDTYERSQNHLYYFRNVCF